MTKQIRKRPVDPRSLQIAKDLLKAVEAGLVDNLAVIGYHTDTGAMIDNGTYTRAGLIMLKVLHEKQSRKLSEHAFQLLAEASAPPQSVKTTPKPKLVI